VRGEPAYALDRDVKNNRTCYAGDAYALGKALFETVFVYVRAPAGSTAMMHGGREAGAALRVWKAITLRAGPRQKQDGILKCLQAGPS
jgi:hypothetical protein